MLGVGGCPVSESEGGKGAAVKALIGLLVNNSHLFKQTNIEVCFICRVSICTFQP